MRQIFEDKELNSLSSYALKSKYSRGRKYKEPESDNRTCFQRDRDRIIHSRAFRRLKHKTQVFIALESDHYRSRLTHTIEVSQISRHIARLLNVNEDLAEAISLAHDLGHTPFGHAGEQELNSILQKYHQSFEHNIQSRRVVDKLEIKYPFFDGLNLTYEVREGLIKHSTPWDKTEDTKVNASLEAQIVNLSDEIAYNNHDLDDGLTSGVLVRSDLIREVTLWKEARAYMKSQYANLTSEQLKHLINSYLISRQICDVVAQTQHNLIEFDINLPEDAQNRTENTVAFSKTMKEQNKELRKFLFDNFYNHPDVYRKINHGKVIIRKLFEKFIEDPKFLPIKLQEKITSIDKLPRIVSDYIAGMTDLFAQKEYKSIFGETLINV